MMAQIWSFLSIRFLMRPPFELVEKLFVLWLVKELLIVSYHNKKKTSFPLCGVFWANPTDSCPCRIYCGSVQGPVWLWCAPNTFFSVLLEVFQAVRIELASRIWMILNIKKHQKMYQNGRKKISLFTSLHQIFELLKC